MTRKSLAETVPATQRSKIAERVDVAVEACGGKAAAGDLLNLSAEQVRRFTTGAALPSIAAAVTLARHAGCSLDWLLTGEDHVCSKCRATPADKGTSTPRSYEALLNLESATESATETLRSLIAAARTFVATTKDD